MINLRSWMETHGIPRQEVADQLGITKGHLSTLINANRTPSERQVEVANQIMNLGGPILPRKPKAKKPKPKAKKKPVSKAKKKPKANKLRPLNKFEASFISDVAKSWIAANKNASQDEFVAIVRALSIGIRS